MASHRLNFAVATWDLLPLCCALLFWSAAASAAEHPNICPPAADQVVVRFTYGPEKAPWVYDVTKDFNVRGVHTASGKRICVNAIPRDSGESGNEIKNGRAGPDEVHATSPASDFFVNLINHENASGHGGELLEVRGFLLSSPVVIAAWQPVVERLGGADGIGWKQFFDRAVDGGLRYGQTNPERSGSGLSGLLAQFFAGAQMAKGVRVTRLAPADVAAAPVRDFVAGIHQNIIYYAESTSFYAEKMIGSGPAYADAALLHESDVIQVNNHIRVRELGFPRLVAVYPTEGTFVSNHPYAIVKRDWVDADEQDGAGKYFDYLVSPPVQAQALQYGFRPGVAPDLGEDLYAKVWNEENGTQPFDTRHRFLDAPSGNVVAAVREAFRRIRNRALVYLLIDRSGSMNQLVMDPDLGRRRLRIDMAAESADLLVRRLQERDRLALLPYGYSVDNADLTPDGQPLAMTAGGKRRLRDALDRIEPNGGTAMRNAIGRAWTSICRDIKRNPHDRAMRLIVVLTDGEDNASAISTDKLIELVGYAAADGHGGHHGDPACKIPVFGVAFGDEADAAALSRITEASGGETRKGGPAEIRAIFRGFSALL